MKIEIWSDFVCPFCYLGKRRLEMALDQFPQKQHVMIEYKSYELDPHGDKDPDMGYMSLLAHKYNMTLDKVRDMTSGLQKQAEDVGLTFNFETIQLTNTFDAHRVAKHAIKQGKGYEMIDRLFKAFFIQSENIGDHSTLRKLASDIGLTNDDIEAVLVTNEHKRAVLEDENQAKQIGVQCVPFYVFNEKYAVSGAQPPDILLKVLEDVWEEVKDDPRTTHKTTYCSGDGCGKES